MPRPGPRRPLLSARMDLALIDWLHERSEIDGVRFPDFVRRAIAYARLHMPVGWVPPEEVEDEETTS